MGWFLDDPPPLLRSTKVESCRVPYYDITVSITTRITLTIILLLWWCSRRGSLVAGRVSAPEISGIIYHVPFSVLATLVNAGPATCGRCDDRYIDEQLFCKRTKWTSDLESFEPYQAPFDTEFELLLNLAVGGQLPGRFVDDDIFPATMWVDYVRYENECEAYPSPWAAGRVRFVVGTTTECTTVQ